MNATRPKGNNKHLDISERIEIEKGLANGESFREIARKVNKDPSTISKEVRKHSKIAERGSKEFAPIPCKKNVDPKKPKARICKMLHVCGDNECNRRCKMCYKYQCSTICKDYEPIQCEKLQKPPYVCNGCSKNMNCLLERRIYSSKYAQDCYEDLLKSSREGINQTPESIQKMNDILTPLIKKGQSLGHIYATHADEIGCSRRTAYTYIDKGVFEVRNIDLRRSVKYKPRKRKTETSLKDRAYRKNRTYADFNNLLQAKVPGYVVEMDTVIGKKETNPCLLTMLFRNCKLMLIFLLKTKTQDEVKKVFDTLTEELGIELFSKLFNVILTDNGTEFQNPEILEYDDYGEKRTSIYYCDPYRSNQKGALEKNHEYIRYVIPKGTSLVGMTKENITLLMNHINSEKRDSLNGHSPYELSQILLDKELHQCLNLRLIQPDDVNLKPELLK